MTERLERQYTNELINIEEMISAFPYTRKGYRKGYFKKYKFTYDEYNDIYICPNEKDLITTGINKDGYIIYKAKTSTYRKSLCRWKNKVWIKKYIL